MKNNFECAFRRADGFCTSQQIMKCYAKRCNRYFHCENCKYNLYTISQEPCADCYLQSKDTVIEHVMKGNT